MKILKFWHWPDGIMWRVILSRMYKSRQRRFKLFMNTVQPKESDTILDIGAGEGYETALNFFEEWYPHRKNITALGIVDLPSFRKKYPEIKFVIGDGRELPFKDSSFDIYFSNAVLEHVGSFEQQKKFVQEACRVAPKIFISTPNRWFPIDVHTLIPFAHYLPQPFRGKIYRFLGKDYFSTDDRLRLTCIAEILRMLPENVIMKVYPQRILGMTLNLNIVITRK